MPKYQFFFFNTIVVGHFLEHISQIGQLYLLHWPRATSLGILGMWHPEVVMNESLHYSLALFMLLGLTYFNQFVQPGLGKKLWELTMWLQFLHYLEHWNLVLQKVYGVYLYSANKPMSFGEIWLPRAELHFIYNAIVLVGMLVSLYAIQSKRELTHA